MSFDMKYLLLLAVFVFGWILAGCSPSDSGDSVVQTSSTTEAYELKQQLRKFDTDPRVYENELVVAANEAMGLAYQAFTNARSEHPTLKPLMEKNQALQSQASQAKLNGDEDAFKALMGEYSSIRMQIETESRTLEDLKPLLEASVAAEKAYFDAKHAAMKLIPEAKPLVEKLESL